MIIQCEQCQTKFRLDDSKVTDKGVKVRCAKCKHVFNVKKDQEEAEPQADFGALLDQSVSSSDKDEPSAPLVPQQESPAPGSSFDYSDFIAEDFSIQNERVDVDAFEPGKEEQAPFSVSSGDEFSLSSLDGDQGFAQDNGESQATAGEVDFGGFDLNAGVEDADKTVVARAPATDFGSMTMIQPSAATPVVEADDADAFEFGAEPMPGDAGVAPEAGMPEEPIQFDTPLNGFADTDATAVDSPFVETASAAPTEGKGDDSFSLGEIEFGDEPDLAAMLQAHPEEQNAGMEQPSGQLAGIQMKSGPDVEQDSLGKGPAMEAPQAQQEEPPPLSIASRRKHNPAFGVLIAVATVVAVAVLGFFGYTMFFEDKGKVVVEAGRITVRTVEATFVKNPAIGDLLVITGEAVNAFTKPRAAIQVKGMVYGGNGQVLAAKSAYCGNPLTKEQLAGMPLDKIEAAMANQFGDSLANLEVAPGKAIPFVIVIAKPPAEAKDYGVEPTGSTVATGKQQ